VTFYIVDVFAEEKYAGNQLAVVRGGAHLSTDEMQRIAREMHFSETTFITAETPREGGFDVRIFTPGSEVPFAGHPTLGTAHIIWEQILKRPADEVALNLKVGQIPVSRRVGSVGALERGASERAGGWQYWMRQVEPEFRATLERGTVAAVLGLTEADLDPRFPVQEVSTGLPHIIVPIRKLEALKRICVARSRYDELVATAWAKAILVFCPEPHEAGNHASVRMFADWYGVPEDPATGSGNGALAAYLVQHRYWGEDRIDIRVEQGYEMLRPSRLYLQAAKEAGKIRVSVGGRAITVARGELL
jgi:trans-2,3-dihydro-3-hydroxyanthranilate isomerase